MKGIIALDIDGTTCLNGHPPSEEIILALNKWYDEGWQIIFITGRNLKWAADKLKCLPFSYAISPQNGALIVEYPSLNLLSKHYLAKNQIKSLSREQIGSAVIYLGDSQEQVLWNPLYHSESMRRYLTLRYQQYQENWIEASMKWSDLPGEFASCKWFGDEITMQKESIELESKNELHCPAIKDPFDEDVWIALATNKLANKGEALLSFSRLKDPNKEGITISAGDDFNDMLLLEKADIGIAMPHAPFKLKRQANIVANSGLIEALEIATKQKG